MLTKGDISDIISQHLSGGGAVAVLSKASGPLRKWVFISDWELKKQLKPGQKSVQVPANAIISPLSLDWLDYNGIRVLR